MKVAELQFLAKEIEKELGIIYAEVNYYQLEHRIQDFCHQVGLKGIEELVEQLKNHSLSHKNKTLFFDLCTNNETSFFRDRSIFDAFRESILPSLKERRSIRVWSAAASSGQEVYSLAMEVDRYVKQGHNLEVHFLATDISETILNKARLGEYSAIEISRGLTSDELQTYFETEVSGKRQVKSFLKRNIQFQKQNLLENLTHLGEFDVIFCRNVLIYQTVESKKSVLKQMTKILKPNGILVLGAAESLFGISEDFNQISAQKAVYYQKKNS
jgi:chemotaxis protein methyltransferase CheR